MKNDTPIIFCHGLLGWGEGELFGVPYYVTASQIKEELQNEVPPFVFTSTGPVSSLHDQACELFFQLKGGLTDYGEEHSQKYQHKRYSRFYGDEKDFDPSVSSKYGGKPIWPQWSKDNPLDFVGHSMGGPLLTTLQQMLATDYFHLYCGFEGHTDSSWINSISSVTAVHNGTQLTWFLGANEETGSLEKSSLVVKFLCFIIKICGMLQNKVYRKNYIYDFHLDQWNLNNEKDYKKVLENLVNKNMSFSDGEDWAMYDLTPNSMQAHNKDIKEYPDTWYFSYPTKSTFSLFGLVELFIPVVCHWYLTLTALIIGNYKAKNEKWKKLIKTWHNNDGMCPTEGQKYPYLGRTENPQYINYRMRSKDVKFQKGKWNVLNSKLMDHLEVAAAPHKGFKKKDTKLYKKIIENILSTRDSN